MLQRQSSKVKLQITTPDGTVYTYTLNPDSYGSYETFPLSGSNGTYQADLYENVTDDKYALIFSQSLNVTLKDEFQPYLYPNQYVWFTKDSKAVKKGGRHCLMTLQTIWTMYSRFTTM